MSCRSGWRPVQAIVLPIADRHLDYARQVQAQLLDAGVRPELDDRTESVGRKIRDAELRKIPYMLVVGDRESESGEVSVRAHRGGDAGAEPVAAFAATSRERVENSLGLTANRRYTRLTLLRLHQTPRGTA